MITKSKFIENLSLNKSTTINKSTLTHKSQLPDVLQYFPVPGKP